MNDPADNSEVLARLAELGDHAGFKLLSAHFEKERTTLNERLLSETATPDAELAKKRAVLNALPEFSPATMLAQLQSNHRAALKREDKPTA